MSPTSSLSPVEHTAIGACAGMIEVCIMQPTVAVKNALQEGRPLPTNPAAYYRGLLVNGGSIAPITAIQFGAHRIFEQAIQASTGSELTRGLQVIAATGAGVTSSLVGCPAEMVMIQQQRAGRSLFQEATHFVRSYGALRLYRGMVTTATRDGIYTASYLGLSPALQDYLDKHAALQQSPPAARFLLAGIASGALAALVTQPVDTVKTRMQAFVEVEQRPEYRNIRSTARHLVQTQGVASLWTGIVPRLVRLCGATIILRVVRNSMIQHLEDTRAYGSQDRRKPVQ